MHEIFSKPDIQGVLLVDATNAFNTLHRKTAICNIKTICPALAMILSNTYQAPFRMFIHGGDEILSQEGTTQGDPLSMAMYSLAITPLIRRLHNVPLELTKYGLLMIQQLVVNENHPNHGGICYQKLVPSMATIQTTRRPSRW